MVGLVTHFAITLTAKILYDLRSSDTVVRTTPKTIGVIWGEGDRTKKKL
jgi:hypothetical protein